MNCSANLVAILRLSVKTVPVKLIGCSWSLELRFLVTSLSDLKYMPGSFFIKQASIFDFQVSICFVQIHCFMVMCSGAILSSEVGICCPDIVPLYYLFSDMLGDAECQT